MDGYPCIAGGSPCGRVVCSRRCSGRRSPVGANPTTWRSRNGARSSISQVVAVTDRCSSRHSRAVGRGEGGIIVARLDRLARSAADALGYPYAPPERFPPRRSSTSTRPRPNASIRPHRPGMSSSSRWPMPWGSAGSTTRWSPSGSRPRIVRNSSSGVPVDQAWGLHGLGLHGHWHRRALSPVSANNSFKPKPLRGSA